MRKFNYHSYLVLAALAVFTLQACKDDSHLVAKLPVPDQSFMESFDTLLAAQSKGWLIKNRSEPIGRGIWTQGNSGNQFMGSATAFHSTSTNLGFISSDYTACHMTNPFEGVLSNWVISPAIWMQNGDKIIFYVRGTDSIMRWGDRMQLCINVTNDGHECGRGLDPGDFNVVLVDINPNLAQGFSPTTPATYTPPFPYAAASPPPFPQVYSNIQTFPNQWTRFEGTVSGLNGPHKGRFAFRYFVPMGGDNGRADFVCLDYVTYKSVGH